MRESFSFPALGTRWWVEIFDDIDEEKFATVCTHIHSIANTFENNYSRFKRNSIISILNTEREFIEPSEEFLDLLSYGQSLYRRTNQTFNFLVGHILEARGYDADYKFELNDESKLPYTNPSTDLLITPEKIRLENGNVDLGGFGKGWLIDVIADTLRESEIEYFLINGGGDIYVSSNQGEPITIQLEHPTEESLSIGEVALQDKAFAASSPFKRQWMIRDKSFNHIVSSHETVLHSSYVTARTARDADAFATAALLLNEEKLLQIAQNEDINITRFSPNTNSLWRTRGFDTV